MYEPVGTVDHFLSHDNYRSLAYEWSNLRFASAWINSTKGTLDDQVLDPFVLKEDWFEILLPSLQLVLTDKVPLQQRQKAQFTLERLRLQDDERVEAPTSIMVSIIFGWRYYSSRFRKKGAFNCPCY